MKFVRIFTVFLLLFGSCVAPNEYENVPEIEPHAILVGSNNADAYGINGYLASFWRMGRFRIPIGRSTLNPIFSSRKETFGYSEMTFDAVEGRIYTIVPKDGPVTPHMIEAVPSPVGKNNWIIHDKSNLVELVEQDPVAGSARVVASGWRVEYEFGHTSASQAVKSYVNKIKY